MASIVSYSPQGIIDKALFNFDAMGGGLSDYRLSGTVTVSVSAPFVYSQYLSGQGNNMTWTPDVAAVYWNASQVANINSILSIYKQFINVAFTSVVDYTQYSPLGVGLYTNSDINISLIYRTNLAFSGISSINQYSFGYTGSQLDVMLNTAGFGSSDYSLNSNTYGFHTLMHELGHSLGLSHPHIAYNSVTQVSTLSSDFSATTTLGFNNLGFVINSANDMNKEYFTIMSYDSERPANAVDTYAQTPMILDVIALQNAYGVGGGTSGGGSDTITPGSATGLDSYRTYFDTGGTDSINLSNYSTGAYLHMGTSIVGANHLVGVSMSMADHQLMVNTGSPQSLRWFYGEFENATGSASNDLITGNNLNNIISGGSGDDSLAGGDGNDSLYGNAGNDTFDWDSASRLGNDTMYGGTGDDTYVVDSINDVVVELANEGVDKIYADFTYSLALVKNVESLSLYGTGNINATGNSLNNTLDGTSGNNILDGGNGIDTAVYTGTAASHTVTNGSSTATVADKITNRDGTDSLTNIERLQFSDFNIALDIGKDQSAGSAYMLYRAALDREPDYDGLGFWISALDRNVNINDVAQAFMTNPEYVAKCGADNSTTQFVTNLYANALHRPLDKPGFDFWVNGLDKGLTTRAAVLEAFASSSDNVNQVASLIANGIPYTEYVG